MHHRDHPFSAVEKLSVDADERLLKAHDTETDAGFLLTARWLAGLRSGAAGHVGQCAEMPLIKPGGGGQHEAAQRQLAEADAWMNEADEQELDDLTGLTPHWGHWHERYDARRLAAEARELIEGGPHN
jgi:hypothetical protein